MTTIAVPDTHPAIACPSWCTVPHEKHLADLPAWEGFVIHWGARSRLATPTTVTYIDGTPDPTAPPMIMLGSTSQSEGLQLDQAEALAYAILVAVQEARS